jgi:cyclic pyranopterin phosphate synthase
MSTIPCQLVNYLRISITDRCNLRCFYCMPQGNYKLLKHSDILSYEEILSVVAAAVKLGIHKFRLTGGEPLVRKGVCELIRKMISTRGVKEVVLTTNGVLLADMLEQLYVAGIRRLNISLDTLQPHKYYNITNKDYFHRVLLGIKRASKVGMKPIKINVVVIKGVNDDELEDFVKWAIQNSLSVRFIEYMPIGCNNNWYRSKVIPIDDIRHRIKKIVDLHPLINHSSDGPAERYRIGSTEAEVGFIAAVRKHNCNSCNRMRLTPEGKLRPCLMSDEEINIKSFIRGGCDEATLKDLISKASVFKFEHRNAIKNSPMRMMSSIGG